MTKARYLIVNGDDFGLSPGVNRGVVRAHDEGILTSASLMVRYPAAAEAAALAKARPKLSVGLHLDLGEWFFRDGEWVALHEVVPLHDVAAVERETRSQLQTFCALMGRAPSHIDSHQHVHRRSALAGTILRIAGEYRVPLRHFGPATYCGAFYGQTTDGSPLPQLVSPSALSSLIASLTAEVTELCCHPGEGEDLNQLETMYRHERQLEVESLCQPGLRQLLFTQGLGLCSFLDMPNRSC